MSYHRSGYPGAVAVSYGVNAMAPLSPNRRYSSTNSPTTTSGIGSSTTTTKYDSCRSPMGSLERTYTTTISSSYRLPGRRIPCSPTRSVSSYSDTSSLLSSTSTLQHWSSTGTSSASSSVSSSSSTRERTVPPTTKILTADDVYQKYSPRHYVPNLQSTRDTIGNYRSPTETTPVNGHCRFPLTTSLPGLAELHGGDEKSSINERWSRQAKRRGTPLSSGFDEIDATVNEVKGRDCEIDINPAPSASDPNANNNTNEFNVNCNELKIEDHESTSSSLSSPDTGWGECPGGSFAVTNNRDELVTNNNAQECCKRLSEVESGRKGQWSSGEGVSEEGHRVRPGNHDESKPSTSRRNQGFPWCNTEETGNSGPVAVHQVVYRGLTEEIEESSSKPNRSRIAGRRDESYGLNGLRNIGNTCFMNSVIQCLSNTPPLLEYLRNELYLNDINTTTSSMKGALIKSFAQVIHELWESSGERVVNTTALKSQIQRFAPRFIGYAQQDAQEFLRYLLEGLHEDVNRVTIKPTPILTDIPDHYSDSLKATESWKRYLRSEDSTIVDVFVGQLRSSLTCTACDHVSVTLDPVWDLSLPIPVRTGTVKLNQCLEHFTKAEVLDGDEKPTCSKCQTRRKCTKSFGIQKFPKILVIHLKRFSPTERFRAKLSVLVDFPLTGLDLSAFAAPDVQGCTYNLYGVANHSGTPYSGHYTAYCKHPYSGEWHEYNDSRVSPVSASSVISSEAYVLFYEQQTHL